MMLNRKLVRDLRLWFGQIVAIAAVAACGIIAFVTMQSNYDAMYAARANYYRGFRFADVFATVARAPRPLLAQLSSIQDVTTVDARVVTDVLADIPGRDDAATLRLVSIPDGRQPALNRVYLRSGRLPARGSRDEIVLSAAFANENHLVPGSRLTAIVNGHREHLRVAGIGLSPEYVYEIRGGDVFPDSRHFGVAWMNVTSLAAALDMTDAFNEVSVAVSKHGNREAVISAMDRVLARYGSLGAYGRNEQISDRFVSNELAQLRAQAIAIPLIFLGIASFLLNGALARLVATQREQIAVLKAFGFSNASIGVHYVKAALVAVALGSAAGVLGGWWLGFQLAQLYTRFFRFPTVPFFVEPRVVIIAVSISAASAIAGAAWAVRSAVRLPPAEAMRAPAPANYRATLLERLRLASFFSPGARMVIRTIERRPLSSAFSVVAIACAVAVLVVGRSTYDSVGRMMNVQFDEVSREDATIAFMHPRSARAASEVRHLPGVLASEPFRSVFARVSNGYYSRRVALLGLVPRPALHRIVDRNGRVFEPPLRGVLMTGALAKILGVRPGESIDLAILEGRRRTLRLRVANVVDELIGLNVYMRADRLNAMLGESGSISGAYVRLDPSRTRAFDAALKRTPSVAGVSYRRAALDEFNKSFGESIGISAAFILGFAGVIAAGVVYNSGRVALSERARELATLRILGYDLRATALMLIGEQGLLTVVAVPVGFLFGNLLNRALQPLYEIEYYRIPVVTTSLSYVLSAAFTLLAAALSAAILVAQLRRFHLVEALKAGE